MILLLPSAPAAFHPSNPEATAAPIDTTYDISPSPPLYTGSRPHVRLAISPHLPYTGGTGHCHGRVRRKGEHHETKSQLHTCIASPM